MKYFFKNEQIRYKTKRVKYGSLKAEEKKKIQFPDFVDSDNPSLIRLDKPIGTFDLIKSSDDMTAYMTIWQEFAFSDFSKGKTIERFFERFGPLNGDYSEPGASFYPVSKFLAEQEVFLSLVTLYIYRNDPAKIAGYLKRYDKTLFRGITAEKATQELAGFDGLITGLLNIELREINTQTYFDPGGDPQFTERMAVTSLLQSIYVRFNLLVVGGDDLKRCKNFGACGFYYHPSSVQQKFHNNKCLHSYYDNPTRRKLQKIIAGLKKEKVSTSSKEYLQAAKALRVFNEGSK